MLWIELLIGDCGVVSEDLRWLHGESNELISIFTTMSKNVKRRMK